MATNLEIQTAILDVSKNHFIQTSSDISLQSRINTAVTEIAGGIRLPNGEITSPLPDLYSSGTVATATDAAYESLPDTYQRNVFYIADDSGDRILPPNGGDYNSFGLFLDKIQEKDLSESGIIYHVAVKGTNLYYQGIPTASEDLTVHFYRKPVDMSENTDTPDGIPAQFQLRLVKHYVCRQLANEMVDGTERMVNYHDIEFYKAAIDLQDFIGDLDAEPVYYSGGNDNFVDAGICD